MSDRVTVLAHLARVIAAAPVDEPLAVRLCRAYVKVLGADGGAITLASTTSQRLTLSTSNGVSAQLEVSRTSWARDQAKTPTAAATQ